MPQLIYTLEEIKESYINGQFKQMAEQIDSYKSLNNFMDQAMNHDVEYSLTFAMIADMVLKYTAIKGI